MRGRGRKKGGRKKEPTKREKYGEARKRGPREKNKTEHMVEMTGFYGIEKLGEGRKPMSWRSLRLGLRRAKKSTGSCETGEAWRPACTLVC